MMYIVVEEQVMRHWLPQLIKDNNVKIMSKSDTVRVPSDLATKTQIFCVVNTTFEIGCMATNILFTYDDRKK